jgi:hypothetical protein
MNKIALNLLLLLNAIITHAQDRGHFTITTDPSSAAVRLTEFPDVVKKTPANFSDYKPMLYSIHIEKQNYQPIDTLIHCLPGRIMEYHFLLNPLINTCNIVSYPSAAEVYINHQKVGITPLTNHPIRCGSNVITLIDEKNNNWQQTYHVSESLPLLVSHDFTQTSATVNATYSNPIDTGLHDYSTTDVLTEDLKSAPGGFGTVGFFAMIGANGAKGTSYRYGADLFHYLRIWGESNKESDINGFGLEGILPLDLNMAAFYLKGGLVSRSFKPANTSTTENITFATIGAGLTIKPTPHFQIFAEFEFGVYDEDEYQETIVLWEDTYSNFSSGSGWIGIRVAF